MDHHRTSTAKPGRYACIDCGSNTTKLIIADLTAGGVPVYEGSETTRIGEGMQAHGMQLQSAPMRRTLDAIDRFVNSARESGAQDTVVIGTAALRDAQNRAEFVEQVKARTGLKLEVISGEEEARLSFLAVRRDPHWRAQPHLVVIDIGGGSTELIQGEEGADRVQSRISVNLGAVKLTESYLRSDPATADEVRAANDAAAAAFASVPLQDGVTRTHCVVGVGGTLTNLGAMKLHSSADLERVHGMTLLQRDLDTLCSTLAERSVEERRKLGGLDPRRADIILAGVILLIQALAHIHSDRIDICTRGLRWGVLYDRFLFDTGAGVRDQS